MRADAWNPDGFPRDENSARGTLVGMQRQSEYSQSAGKVGKSA